MKKRKKKIIAGLLTMCMSLGALTGCSANGQNGTAAEIAADGTTAPKYVFLFVGDGMSYPQIQSTSDLLGALNDEDYFMAQPSLDDNQGAVLDGPEYLNFMNFEAAGSAVTYDSNSFAPDSASTATSISTGEKTYSGTINVDITGTETFETITEKVHEQLGMKVGIISSVNLNHATPAAFYAHQESRNNYYEIGEELVNSGFEYFAGGGLKKVNGNDDANPQPNLYDPATEAGYKVTFTNEEAAEINADSGNVILIDEHLADSDAMAYEIDRTEDMWSLADYVEKGIEVLDNEKGFFMMCE
ncbi:MAG: alkaline phosphatase, partial [Peptococcaceae bacterium]|nr:alkaline phosphatase [Peptococcaceae bacterium]